MPVPAKPASEPTVPFRPIVGLPATPFPLVTDTPVDPVIVRPTKVEALVFACKPTVDESRLATAPDKLICMVDCAPPSVKVKPDPTDKARLLIKLGS